MRRILAIVLLSVFVLQSTGSASAAPAFGNAVAPFHVILARAFGGAVDAFHDSQLFALISGTEGQYGAMHAPPPRFDLVPRVRPLDSRFLLVRHDVPRIPVTGRPITPPGMLAQPPTPEAMQGLRIRAAQEFAHHAKSQPLSIDVRTKADAVRILSVNTAVLSTTGLNPYWSYEQGTIPGAGQWLVNVANGNMIVQDDDIEVPERGIDLAFRRTYNEQSGHDYVNTDGSTMSNYGEGWTNNFDAHIGYDPAANAISVYDIDGARYDYTWNGSAWAAPPGQHATLQSDGGCGFLWIKKSGTMYDFFTPAPSVSAGTCTFTSAYAGYFGRIYRIWGRNNNNYIAFSYAWSNGDSSTGANLTQIVAQHSDGQALTLNFADFSGHRLLASISRPDWQTVYYSYDSSGDLTDVCDIGNGTYDNSPAAVGICGDTAHQHHRYGWVSDHVMYWADSPRYTMNWGSGVASIVAPGFDSAGRLTALDNMGNVNFAVPDITSSTLQPTQPTGFLVYGAKTFSYTTGQTAYTDFDGHAATYIYDNLGRVTQTRAYTGAIWLISNATWDTNDNITASVDARGNESDYAYDTSGNIVEVALPSVTTSAGSFRPTSVYSYDGYDNVTAYCDPTYSNGHGLNWTAPPPVSDSRCSATIGGGSSVYVYNTTDTSEPFGLLTDMYKPSGYRTRIAYATGGLTGDAGLPTSVAGTGFTQVDGTIATPSQGIAYDAAGDVIAYTTLSTVPAPGNESTLTYDSVNRPTSVTDPDGYTAYKYYAANGALVKTETPFQHSAGLGPTTQYDDDGNAVKTFAYVGGA